MPKPSLSKNCVNTIQPIGLAGGVDKLVRIFSKVFGPKANNKSSNVLTSKLQSNTLAHEDTPYVLLNKKAKMCMWKLRL